MDIWGHNIIAENNIEGSLLWPKNKNWASCLFFLFLYTILALVNLILSAFAFQWTWNSRNTCDIEGNSGQCYQQFLCSITCMWKLTPFWRNGNWKLFVSTWLEKIQQSQSWSSQVGALVKAFVLVWIMGWMMKFNKIGKYVYLEYIYVKFYISKFGIHIHILKLVKVSMTGWWVSFTMSLNAAFVTCLVQGVAHTTEDGCSCNGQHPRP